MPKSIRSSRERPGPGPSTSCAEPASSIASTHTRRPSATVASATPDPRTAPMPQPLGVSPDRVCKTLAALVDDPDGPQPSSRWIASSIPRPSPTPPAGATPPWPIRPPRNGRRVRRRRHQPARQSPAVCRSWSTARAWRTPRLRLRRSAWRAGRAGSGRPRPLCGGRRSHPSPGRRARSDGDGRGDTALPGLAYSVGSSQPDRQAQPKTAAPTAGSLSPRRVPDT